MTIKAIFYKIIEEIYFFIEGELVGPFGVKTPFFIVCLFVKLKFME